MQKQQRKRRSKGTAGTNRYYFTAAVDEAIVRYNNTADQYDRSRIYQQEIRPAFEKLVEFIINTFKYYYLADQTMQQAQQEVVSFLVERLDRFKPENGKAFSYYSMIAKHYCIQRNKTNYKKLTSHATLSNIGDAGVEDTLAEEPDNVEFSEDGVSSLQRFQNIFVDYWDERIDSICPKKADKHVAAAVIELFRRRETLELFNKKALYIYVREIADVSGAIKATTTPQITKVVRIVKGKYKEMYKDFLTYGSLIKDKVY